MSTPIFPSTLVVIMSNVAGTVVKILKPQKIPAPTMIPTSNERLTSFVINETIIARLGGIKGQHVACIKSTP